MTDTDRALLKAVNDKLDKLLNSAAGYGTKADGTRDDVKRSAIGRIEDQTRPVPAA